MRLALAHAASAAQHSPNTPVGAFRAGRDIPAETFQASPDRPAGAVAPSPDSPAGTDRASLDVPVGAVVVAPGGGVLASAVNRRERDHDPTAHAEMVALRAASAELKTWRLDGCTLVVTLEPCAMCAGALIAARVDRVVFGAWDPKAGACGSVWDLPRDRGSLHHPEVIGGVLADECAALLGAFFASRREKTRQAW
jgi:tRNA(adenine34) deaminase